MLHRKFSDRAGCRRAILCLAFASTLAGSSAAQKLVADSANTPGPGGSTNSSNAVDKTKLKRPAQEQVIERAPSITLSPAVMMVKGKPGQSFSQDLTLYNNTALELAFSLEARDVVVRDGKRIFVPAGETQGGIARNAVFNHSSVVVGPGGSAAVSVTVTIPPAPAARAIACIFMGKTTLGTKNSMAMTGSLGALVTFTLSDDFRVESRPMQIAVDPDSQLVTFHQILKNTGTDPVVPKGVIAVTDANGALITRLPMPSQRMLPGEILEFSAEHSGLFRAGKYRAMLLMENETAFFSNATEFNIK